MTPTWSNAARQRITNEVLTSFSIPIEVQYFRTDAGIIWHAHARGGTLETAMELIYRKQDAIMRKVEKGGMEAVSRRDALFMYVSQWLEWTLVKGESHPEHDTTMELMEGWAIYYKTRGQNFAC